MRRLSSLVGLALGCWLLASPANADSYPDYLSVGGGGYNFDKADTKRKSLDYRIEYRWGVSILPLLSPGFKSIEPFFQLHPAIGIEGNSKGAVYGHAGVNLDIPLLKHGLLTWGESIGAFGRGNDTRSMGAVLQFRSQLELGWQFQNDLRITGFVSHISSGGVIKDNPGAEMVGVYLHFPLSLTEKK